MVSKAVFAAKRWGVLTQTSKHGRNERQSLHRHAEQLLRPHNSCKKRAMSAIRQLGYFSVLPQAWLPFADPAAAAAAAASTVTHLPYVVSAIT
jgi:hypothetical protein